MSDTSVIAICNRALDFCRAAPISALTDASEAARLCSRNYTASRDAVLHAYPWNAALRRASLPALAEPPAWGYTRQYELPQDCLRIHRIADNPAYAREGRRLLTDAAAPLYLLYIARIEDPSTFDPLLVEAIAARLAYDIGGKLIESSSAEASLLERYQRILVEARQIDAQEGTPEAVEAQSGWLEVRL